MSQSFKYYSTIVIVLVVNLTFLIKYLSRATAYYLPVALLITAICAAIWHYRFSLNQWLEKRRFLNSGLIVVFVVVASVVFAKIPYQSLNVDRWSVITSFWDNYFSGEYVYFAKSNFGNPPDRCHSITSLRFRSTPLVNSVIFRCWASSCLSYCFDSRVCLRRSEPSAYC
jgi:lysylphosphatidylglycerol synthetase-like protein (DUF2156 family)